MNKNKFTILHYKNCLSRHVFIHHMGWAKYQGFSFLSEVVASGLLNLEKKAFPTFKLGKPELDRHFKWFKKHKVLAV